jgi:hypothetical protein
MKETLSLVEALFKKKERGGETRMKLKFSTRKRCTHFGVSPLVEDYSTFFCRFCLNLSPGFGPNFGPNSEFWCCVFQTLREYSNTSSWYYKMENFKFTPFLVKFTPFASMFFYQFNYFCGQVLELCPDWLSMKGCEFNQKRCEFKNVLIKWSYYCTHKS